MPANPHAVYYYRTKASAEKRAKYLRTVGCTATVRLVGFSKAEKYQLRVVYPVGRMLFGVQF